MLKKTGVVVGVLAATLLALSPLANAAPAPKAHAEQIVDPGDDPTVQNGLVNLGDLNLLNGVNVCGVTAGIGLGNVLGILGSGASDTTTTGGDTTCVNSAVSGLG